MASLSACGGPTQPTPVAHQSSTSSTSASTTAAPLSSIANPATADAPVADGPVQPETSIVAQATGPTVNVYATPVDGVPAQTLTNPESSGSPLVFLVRETRSGWLHVLLPVRPNGSSGWIKQNQVQLSQHDFRILVELGAHRITVYQGTATVDREPIGVGTHDTPTPGGLYYTKELLRPPNPAGPYGPYAYGLSGFSDAVPNFAGGDGVIGIHGTNDPTSLGHDASHGCIRMSNTGITKLARTLPLGVPVEISA